MANIFNQIQLTRPKKNSFDLSHERKFSMNMGDLVPVMLQEVVPGDSFRVNMEHLIRLQPLQSPMMHRVNSYTHFFFVPNRLVWDEFENFITGGEDGKANPVFPRLQGPLDSSTWGPLFKPGSLADYLGFPSANLMTQSAAYYPKISLLPFRGYNLIYNEYYRDQNLQPKTLVSKLSGISNATTSGLTDLLTLKKRAWEKDYYTSALPFAQRGEQLSLPINGFAPVRADGEQVNTGVAQGSTGSDSFIQTNKPQGTPLRADLSGATSSTVNELRSAFSIQKWMEKSARGGSRYVEHIKAVFGQNSSDARHNRPEYLGGGKTPIIISEVMQQSATQANSPQGTLAGHGISAGSSNRFTRKFEEHGFIIGIMSVLPRTAYCNGLPRIWTKFDKFDYLQPDLAQLGEQSVYNSELYLETSDDKLSENTKTFGYQPRYAEYRFANSSIHGDFLNNLEYWHMARFFHPTTKFPAAKPRPALNGDFIKSKPTHRVFANTTETDHKLLVQTYVNCKAVRPLPKFGNPGGL